MRTLPLYWILLVLTLPLNGSLCAQDFQFRGQATGWLSSATSFSQGGLRYIPEASFNNLLSEDLNTTFEASANMVASSRFSGGLAASVKPYRLWARIATDRWEIRAGLQKINFGPAVLFRPLMWFDAIDPRDPLQLTDGIYGILTRYYFPENSNLWLWGLYGNNERKGLETVPSTHNSIEFGGRIQTPLWEGELGASYHHRTAEMRPLTSSSVPENRIALDGKWDAGVGLWFELAVTNRENAPMPFRVQRTWTLGADYTISAGNGLTVLTEYFRNESLTPRFAPLRGNGFSALSLVYPLDIMDRLSGMAYYDWTNDAWYRLASVQRTYDNWAIYLLGFWNPPGASAMNGSNAFSGTGAQVMVVFNH